MIIDMAAACIQNEGDEQPTYLRGTEQFMGSSLTQTVMQGRS